MADNNSARDPQTSPEEGERLRVARIGKPHGIKGEVTVQLYTDDPDASLAPGVELIREPGEHTVDRGTARLTIRSQRWNKQICLLGFEEIPDRNAAEALRGSMLHIEVVPQDSGSDEWYSYELEGLRCFDADGTDLGVVTELFTGEAQDLLLVETPAGSDVMVPFVQQIVPDIDIDAGRITVHPPHGLFPTG